MRSRPSEDPERLFALLQDDPTDVAAWKALRPLLSRQGRSVGGLFADAYSDATIPDKIPKSKADEDRIFGRMRDAALWLVTALDAFGWTFLLVEYPSKPSEAIAILLDRDDRSLRSRPGYVGHKSIPLWGESVLCIRGAHENAAASGMVRPAGTPVDVPEAASLLVKGKLCPDCLRTITDPDAPLLLSILERKQLAARRKQKERISLSSTLKQRQQQRQNQDEAKERFLDAVHRGDLEP